MVTFSPSVMVMSLVTRNGSCSTFSVGPTMTSSADGSTALIRYVTPTDALMPRPMPIAPPTLDSTTASTKNCRMMSRGLAPNYDNPYGLMAIMGTNVQLHLRAGLLLLAAYVVVLVAGVVAPAVSLFLR